MGSQVPVRNPADSGLIFLLIMLKYCHKSYLCCLGTENGLNFKHHFYFSIILKIDSLFFKP